MKTSIFDSESEKRIYNRLKTVWSKYVDIFPQIPVRNVIEYNDLIKFGNNDKKTEFLLKTSFDFVVCELNNGKPILIIEFDGLSGGFSNEGKFYITHTDIIDQHRELKMSTKLKLCEYFNIPMVVVSYNESNLLSESGDWISILDVIIGDAIEKVRHFGESDNHLKILTEAFDYGGKESAEMALLEVEIMSELNNPIKRKIRDITSKFPRWPSQIVFPREEDNYLIGDFYFMCGFKMVDDKINIKKMMEFQLKMRKVGVLETDLISIFNTIGEYCMARKIEKELGTDSEKWKKALESAYWST